MEGALGKRKVQEGDSDGCTQAVTRIYAGCDSDFLNPKAVACPAVLTPP